MIPILTAEQIKAADNYTIENEPIASIDLMERASEAFVVKFKELVSIDESVAIVCGSGNNGGDGFAIARLLSQEGYAVTCYELFISQRSNDCEVNRTKYIESNVVIDLAHEKNFEFNEAVIIDGLFGSGLNRAIADDRIQCAINAINDSKKTVVAIDVPSGLFCDRIGGMEAVIKADITITFGCPKLSFLFPETGNLVGDFHVIDIGLDKKYIESIGSRMFLLELSDIKSFIKKRKKFTHKGTFGSVQVVAGSEGKMGAALLCGKACFLSGVGLVTMNIPGAGNEIVQTSLPEAMTIFNEAHKCITEIKIMEKTTVFCLGPGIGKSKKTSQALERFLKENPNKPLVLDADAINIIAAKKELIELIPAGSIVTPHAKEFERLLGTNENSLGKIESMSNFSAKTGIIVVSKGAHSVISDVEGNLYFNNSGNPGMATAGSGDVLAGLITGLLAQGMNSLAAAMVGVFLHGLAGDIAEKKVGEMSMMASDLLNELPKAISNVKNMFII